MEFVDNWSPPYEQLRSDLGETDLSFSPNIVANSVFSFQPLDDFNIRFISKYVGQQFLDNTSNENLQLGAYFVNDLNLSYGFSGDFFERMEIFINIANIFSTQYETNAWVYRYFYEGEEYLMAGFFPQAPANFLAGISLKF